MSDRLGMPESRNQASLEEATSRLTRLRLICLHGRRKDETFRPLSLAFEALAMMTEMTTMEMMATTMVMDKSLSLSGYLHQYYRHHGSSRCHQRAPPFGLPGFPGLETPVSTTSSTSTTSTCNLDNYFDNVHLRFFNYFYH